jgi:hypothetical protein
MTREVVGGFGESSPNRARMSDSMLRSIAVEEERYARQAAIEARRHQEDAEELRQRAVQSAIAAAVARGEDVSGPRRLRGESLGHRPSEFVQMISAQQDAEDAHRDARERAAYRRWREREGVREETPLAGPLTPQESARMHRLARAVATVERGRR